MPDNPNSKDFRVRDVAPPRGLADERVERRRDLRARVDRFRRYHRQSRGRPGRGARRLLRARLRPDVVAARPSAPSTSATRPDAVRDAFGRNPFGQRCLLARRLVEAGVPFITLNEGGWDHHVGIFNAYEKRVPAFESSIAALIEDLERRGLLDTTLVIALGEFGRTPKINKDAGRDHWSNAMSVLFAGCGTPGGQVVGATDAARLRRQ